MGEASGSTSLVRGGFARLGTGALTALALLIATGCTKPAQVRSDALPVSRVVVYRNGVAYFERSGEVDEEQVEFQLRQENVGDFLATLAILESGGQSVKSASFPVKLEESDDPTSDPELKAALDSWEGKKPDPRKLRKVTLELDGDKHELTVGYLAETPLWRPSYRLVVEKGGKASLQVWGIVQNQSGEDWKNVKLALVAGAPIAFESTLGDPVVPRRPIVTDQGEVIAAVPEGDASYHVEEAAEPAPAAPAMEAEMADSDDGYYSYGSSEERLGGAHSAKKSASRASGGAAPASAAGAGGCAPGDPMCGGLNAQSAPKPAPSMAPRDTKRLAQVEVQSGATRYEVPHPVTIPDESATMVLLVSKEVPGEAIHLYAPNGGVPDSYRHPFRVVRFTNLSGGMLEKGPIAVFEAGAFLGQGLMAGLPVKGEATVPFALMRDLAIETSTRYEERDSRFYSVENGTLFIERDRSRLTTYEIQNGDQEPAKLVIKHPRSPEATLFQPPAGTKDEISEGAAYVPASVPKFGKAAVTVDERSPMRTAASWESLEARTAIGGYLASGKALPEQVALLKDVLAQAERLAKAGDGERKLRREQVELEENARQTRLSLQAIEKNPNAGELRSTLTKRLAATTARMDQITKELVELGLQRSEAEVRLRESTQKLTIAPVR